VRPVRGLALGLSAVLLAGCSSAADGPDELTTPSLTSAAPSNADGGSVAPTSDPVVVDPVEPDLDLAVSTPVEDSVYPAVGDPGVDALLYDLDLTWDPQAERLTGESTVTFRATRTAPRFQLDLGAPLEVGEVTLDGEVVRAAHRGKNLVVRAPVKADQRYELTVA
jgi:hypothetical protein